jgi:hypothetical protein
MADFSTVVDMVASSGRKATELAKLALRQGSDFDCAKWLHTAKALPFDSRKSSGPQWTG